MRIENGLQDEIKEIQTTAETETSTDIKHNSVKKRKEWRLNGIERHGMGWNGIDCKLTRVWKEEIIYRRKSKVIRQKSHRKRANERRSHFLLTFPIEYCSLSYVAVPRNGILIFEVSERERERARSKMKQIIRYSFSAILFSNVLCCCYWRCLRLLLRRDDPFKSHNRLNWYRESR